MSNNNNLHKARKNKNDEFYTQLTDIEKELVHYVDFFEGKTVYCNCDDARESNFFKYFYNKFEELGLKKLIATGYKEDSHGVVLVYEGDKNDNREIKVTELQGDGDFRSEECIEFLKEADVIVTNPPFSLFREYVKQLMEYNKKFLIIGNMNAITFKEIFPLIKANKLWLGLTMNGSNRWFRVPDNYEKSSSMKVENGIKYCFVKAVVWFTNIEHKLRNTPLDLYKTYAGHEDEYPNYENYDAINVDKVSDIPIDYDGVVDVPITFLYKYNSKQFEIVALGIVGSCEFCNQRKMEILDKSGKPTGKFTINARGALYKKYNPKVDKSPAFKDAETGELYASIYARILIRRKK